eukprot:SM000044S15986  [mRNA]  locus=s44:388582:394443:+ [translate_table: standard]
MAMDCAAQSPCDGRARTANGPPSGSPTKTGSIATILSRYLFFENHFHPGGGTRSEHSKVLGLSSLLVEPRVCGASALLRDASVREEHFGQLRHGVQKEETGCRAAQQQALDQLSPQGDPARKMRNLAASAMAGDSRRGLVQLETSTDKEPRDRVKFARRGARVTGDARTPALGQSSESCTEVQCSCEDLAKATAIGGSTYCKPRQASLPQEEVVHCKIAGGLQEEVQNDNTEVLKTNGQLESSLLRLKVLKVLVDATATRGASWQAWAWPGTLYSYMQSFVKAVLRYLSVSKFFDNKDNQEEWRLPGAAENWPEAVENVGDALAIASTVLNGLAEYHRALVDSEEEKGALLESIAKWQMRAMAAEAREGFSQQHLLKYDSELAELRAQAARMGEQAGSALELIARHELDDAKLQSSVHHLQGEVQQQESTLARTSADLLAVRQELEASRHTLAYKDQIIAQLREDLRNEHSVRTDAVQQAQAAQAESARLGAVVVDAASRHAQATEAGCILGQAEAAAREENIQLEEQVQTLSTAAGECERRLAGAAAELSTAELEIAAASSNMSAGKARRDAVQQELEAAKVALSSSQASVVSLRCQLADQCQELLHVKAALDEKTRTVQSLEGVLTEKSKDLDAAKLALEASRASVMGLEGALVDRSRELRKARQDAELRQDSTRSLEKLLKATADDAEAAKREFLACKEQAAGLRELLDAAAVRRDELDRLLGERTSKLRETEAAAAHLMSGMTASERALAEAAHELEEKRDDLRASRLHTDKVESVLAEARQDVECALQEVEAGREHIAELQQRLFESQHLAIEVQEDLRSCRACCASMEDAIVEGKQATVAAQQHAQELEKELLDCQGVVSNMRLDGDAAHRTIKASEVQLAEMESLLVLTTDVLKQERDHLVDDLTEAKNQCTSARRDFASLKAESMTEATVVEWSRASLYERASSKLTSIKDVQQELNVLEGRRWQAEQSQIFHQQEVLRDRLSLEVAITKLEESLQSLQGNLQGSADQLQASCRSAEQRISQLKSSIQDMESAYPAALLLDEELEDSFRRLRTKLSVEKECLLDMVHHGHIITVLTQSDEDHTGWRDVETSTYCGPHDCVNEEEDVQASWNNQELVDDVDARALLQRAEQLLTDAYKLIRCNVGNTAAEPRCTGHCDQQAFDEMHCGKPRLLHLQAEDTTAGDPQACHAEADQLLHGIGGAQDHDRRATGTMRNTITTPRTSFLWRWQRSTITGPAGQQPAQRGLAYCRPGTHQMQGMSLSQLPFCASFISLWACLVAMLYTYSELTQWRPSH